MFTKNQFVDAQHLATQDHIDFYNGVKAALTIQFSSDDFTSEKLKICDIPLEASHAHHKVVELLKSYEYVTWAGSGVAFFHGYSPNRYAVLRSFNQQLNLAMKFIYENEHDLIILEEDILLKDVVNQLLLDHLKAMHRTNLYSQLLQDVIMIMVSHIKIPIVIKNGFFVTKVPGSVVTIINEDYLGLQKENQELKEELKHGQQALKDMEASIGNRLKKLEDLLHTQTPIPGVGK